MKIDFKIDSYYRLDVLYDRAAWRFHPLSINMRDFDGQDNYIRIRTLVATSDLLKELIP